MARKRGKNKHTVLLQPKGALYSYIMEKLRIRRTLLLVKKEQLLDNLKLLEKREKQVVFVQKKVAALQHIVVRNAQRIENKMMALRSEKETESAQLQRYASIIKALQTNGEQAKKAYASKEQILTRECKLLDDLEVIDNMSKDMDNKKRVYNIISKKQKLLTQSQHNHQNTVSLLFAEKKIVEEMMAKQARAVHMITEKLHGMHASYQKICKEKRALKYQEQSFQKQLQHITLRRKSIKVSLQRKR